MPFTVSHIAAVIPAYKPLSRRHLFSAAVIGSMVPDFSMLLPLNLARWQTHSWQALFTFCVPVGLVTYWLTQLLIKPAVLEVLPDRAFSRLRDEHPSVSILSPLQWLLAAVTIWLGALTHIVWDGFTHEDAHGVRMFPLLSDYEVDLAGHTVRLYRWLQYGSSIVGLVIVVAAIAWWVRRAPQSLPLARCLATNERGLWAALYCVLPLAGLTLAVLQPMSMGFFPLASGWELARVLIAGMRGAAWSLLLISVLLRLRLRA